mmetsp:Transcript_31867/g.95144  ORF Transcript_31867/g.95144 Transcript_31867/m.95144 type:complete len:133 (+) Transcript_31867:492-890(+)
MQRASLIALERRVLSSIAAVQPGSRLSRHACRLETSATPARPAFATQRSANLPKQKYACSTHAARMQYAHSTHTTYTAAGATAATASPKRPPAVAGETLPQLTPPPRPPAPGFVLREALVTRRPPAPAPAHP